MGKSKKVFIVFTAIFLGIILLVGIVLGTLSIVRDARSVMNYKGIYLYRGMANYLSATFKNDYMATLRKSGVDCRDDAEFWNTDAGDGKTYGQLLIENTEKYLKSVLVGSYLFDRNTKLTKNDKKLIEKNISEVLDYKAEGNVNKFNEIGKSMGFTFRDFKKAAKLVYKSEMAKTVIFGFDGAALASGDFAAECDEYFNNNYSRVRVLMIRTDGKLVNDPATGKQVLQEYTESERSAVYADIADVRSRFENGEMNDDAFKWYATQKYPTDTVNDEHGYYFSSSSAYSLNFAKEGGFEIVKFALTADIGDYSEIELKDTDGKNVIGTAFVYKRSLVGGAYSSYILERFFDDFYIKATPYVYSKSLESYLPSVKVKKKYNASAVITQPYNYELGISFA